MTYHSFFLIAQAKQMTGLHIHHCLAAPFFTNKLKEIHCIQLLP